MKNVFSAEEPVREVDPTFAAQAAAQRGGTSSAPSIPAILPPHSPVERPDFEDLAHRSAPGSAVSSALTYEWRK